MFALISVEIGFSLSFVYIVDTPLLSGLGDLLE